MGGFGYVSAARERLTVEPSMGRVFVLVVIVSVLTSFTAAMLRRRIGAGFFFIDMVMLGFAGRLILKYVNLREHD